MTSPIPVNLGIAAALTAAIALLNGGGWLFWLIGAGYALALAVGVWCGSAAAYADWSLQPKAYAVAALVTLAAGAALWWLTGRDDNVWWGVAVILGIASSASSAAWQRAR